jgi:glycosyltransferase involved in cell wall biosynthesis
MTFFFDYRWVGDHGIGRVTRMLDERLCLQHLNISGKPTSPIDPLRMLFAMLKMPKDAAVFSPGYNAQLFMVRPYIFTIHDLNHIDRPENSSILKKIYYYFLLRRACHNAFRVLTVSEFSRQRIISWAHVPPKHVVNIGNGVDDCYRPDVSPYQPGYQYLLCVGNHKAHKNESRVLEAFAAAKIDSTIRLIFTGNANEELMLQCRHLGVENRVIFMGRIPEDHLPGLYKGALALVFPSLYEGFGLPVIEAMACGTPVLTSNTTSLPEVAGDAALLVDPTSINQIKTAIGQLCSDAGLRRSLSQKGLQRAKFFKWDEVANKVKAVLNQMEMELS